MAFTHELWITLGRLDNSLLVAFLSVERLLNITGDYGTQVLGVPRYATVSKAASGGQWNIRRCRGHHLRVMMACIHFFRTYWRHEREAEHGVVSNRVSFVVNRTRLATTCS